MSKNPFIQYNYFLIKLVNFQIQYNKALFLSWSKAVESASNLKESTGKNIQDEIRTTFDREIKYSLRTNDFSKTLSDFIDSFSELALAFDHKKWQNYFEKMIRDNDQTLEPVRHIVNRTPSKIIPMKGKFDIHHYKTSTPSKFKTPLIIVGSLINRYYILDLLPEVSVIRFFQQQGFDVYATDWRMPTSLDKEMSLSEYAHHYLENAVDKVKQITGANNVTLFGYCWGGILSLIYSSLHPESIKNLILHATPVDFHRHRTVLESWINDLDVKRFVRVFGNVPSSFLNIAFWLRNPLEASTKYQFYFNQSRSINEIKQFLAVESWLYDSVPIIGRVFEEIIESIYKKNLLIQNKMMLGEDKINLKNITMPVLNIIGTRDDLVSVESCGTITNVISSKDKKTIEFPTGHVGLCVSKTAHKELWPEVGSWLKEHSD